MEILIVTKSNLAVNQPVFDDYLRARHRVYAEELHWVPAAPDGRELDRYDDEDAVHFIGLEGGRVVAGSRLYPTTKPHLLSETFPHLCRGGRPLSGPTIAEWTRGFVVSERRGDKTILFSFCHAIMEYGLSEGLEKIGGIQRTYWLTMWKWMRWNVLIHGEAVDIDGHPWLPAYFDVTPTALAGAAQRAGIAGSLLVTRGAARPFLRTSEYPLLARSA
jgi:acyl-homoserine lactone synthase